MRTLSRDQIPADYQYYGAAAPEIVRFLQSEVFGFKAVPLGNGEYGWILNLFWGLFSFGRFEKCSIEPTAELLRKHGFKRGLILWSPWNTLISPAGWWEAPDFFKQGFHHSTRSAFSVLEQDDYWSKWSPTARNHRKKIQHSLQSGVVNIRSVTGAEFERAYLNAPLKHANRWYHLRRHRYIERMDPKHMRYYLASVDNKVLAGATCLDYGPTSLYLVAFLHPTGKQYHLGAAIIDRWFSDSRTLGLKYLDFDHMQDRGNPAGYAGYTTFKAEFADFDMYFPSVWWRYIEVNKR